MTSYCTIFILNIILLIPNQSNCSLPAQSSCGTQAISPSIEGSTLNRIIGGSDATANSWPWIVSLRVLTKIDSTTLTLSTHLCGGIHFFFQFNKR